MELVHRLSRPILSKRRDAFFFLLTKYPQQHQLVCVIIPRELSRKDIGKLKGVNVLPQDEYVLPTFLFHACSSEERRGEYRPARRAAISAGVTQTSAPSGSNGKARIFHYFLRAEVDLLQQG